MTNFGAGAQNPHLFDTRGTSTSALFPSTASLRTQKGFAMTLEKHDNVESRTPATVCTRIVSGNIQRLRAGWKEKGSENWLSLTRVQHGFQNTSRDLGQSFQLRSSKAS